MEKTKPKRFTNEFKAKVIKELLKDTYKDYQCLNYLDISANAFFLN